MVISNRMSFYALVIIAPLSWLGLLAFTRFVPPDSGLAFIAFCLILSVALTCTLAPLAYVIGSRVLHLRLYRETIRHSIRQGALLALVIVLNLILRALHSWNIFTAVVIVLAALVVEVLSLAKK